MFFLYIKRRSIVLSFIYLFVHLIVLCNISHQYKIDYSNQHQHQYFVPLTLRFFSLSLSLSIFLVSLFITIFFLIQFQFLQFFLKVESFFSSPISQKKII